MQYKATKDVLLYWKPDQPYYTHRAHHSWFDEYKTHLSSDRNHTPRSQQLQWDPERFPCQSSIQINFVPCELKFSGGNFTESNKVKY